MPGVVLLVDGDSEKVIKATLPDGRCSTKTRTLLRRFAKHNGIAVEGLTLESVSGELLDPEVVVKPESNGVTKLIVRARSSKSLVKRGSENKAALQLLGAEDGRPCLCSSGECHIRKRRDGGFRVVLRGQRRSESEANRARRLVSVLCPTTPERRPLHALVYACFRGQSYSERELVVFESGQGEPSKFWLETAARDERVRYTFDPSHHLAVGLKRNELVRRARGEVVAMCDDDNIYGPTYLETMLLHLETSGARAASLAGFFGLVLLEDRWECYRNVGGRGETLVFWRRPSESPFDATVSWGEESTLAQLVRSDGWHRIWDDAGVFIHLDHGRNYTAVRPDRHDQTRRDQKTGYKWHTVEAGVEWRPAKRADIKLRASLDLLDEWHYTRRIFDNLEPIPSDPRGEQAPDDWYDLPEHARTGRENVLPRRQPSGVNENAVAPRVRPSEDTCVPFSSVLSRYFLMRVIAR